TSPGSGRREKNTSGNSTRFRRSRTHGVGWRFQCESAAAKGSSRSGDTAGTNAAVAACDGDRRTTAVFLRSGEHLAGFCSISETQMADTARRCKTGRDAARTGNGGPAIEASRIAVVACKGQGSGPHPLKLPLLAVPGPEGQLVELKVATCRDRRTA